MLDISFLKTKPNQTGLKIQQEPHYRRDHRAMRSKFRSRLGLYNGTGAPFDEDTQAPPSDIIMIPYI